MVPEVSLLVMLVDLVDTIPGPAPPPRRGRRPVYSDRLFLKAVVIMVVRGVWTVDGLLGIVDQPTREMGALRARLTEHGRFPSRRTWERRLNALSATLPTWIGCLGRHLVGLIQPWAAGGRAVALDSTPLRARGGVWHKKHREAGVVPPRRSTPRPAGPSPAGTAGSTAGSSTWPPRSPRSGSRWRPS